MSMTTTPRPPVRLPDIPLSELPEKTKDFIIAASGAGKSVTEVMREALNRAAADAGFRARKTAR